MPAPQTIHNLVERFDNNIASYKSGNYNETQVRLEFINPFFEALGWDISNTRGYAEAYKDVVHEYSQKTTDSVEAPDYLFKIGGIRKFFVEAKKPSVNLKDDFHPAFQLRRYAWSAKLPLSVLTDFEEFSIYDCRFKPLKNDKASKSRIRYYNYKEYIDNWDEIESIFSRESVLKGSFDKFADANKKVKGGQEVDDAFLKEIETWREVLARNIALRNPELSNRELNFAVQKTIDRIIFLRICEDRGIEEYGELMALQNGANIYPRLLQKFKSADDKYNSGLFHFKDEKGRAGAPDDLTTELSLDDKVLKDIFKNLYYPECPYEFSVLGADILGHVYEQFLGKVIRLTPGHMAKVEDKPEVKKAGGVYYTPTYIVNYIVKNTVGKLVENKKPKQVEKLKILDPACGSGSFLLGAYQFLLDWHLNYYTKEENPETLLNKKESPVYINDSGEYKLTTAERKRILLNNIYGVDIDSQAVEVTKLSLLLKVLEGETEQSLTNQLSMFKQRALPDLGENIKCGNSLIGPDFYDQMEMNFLDEEEKLRINVFDWNTEFKEIMNSGGFDAVIGNPPYDVLEKDRGKSSWPHDALQKYSSNFTNYENAFGGKLNLFRFFLVKSFQIINNNGFFGMIVPLALLADISCKNTRRFIITKSKELLADCFPQKDNPNKRVFKNAKLSTVILTTDILIKDNINPNPLIKIRVFPWNSFDDSPKESSIDFNDLKIIDPENLPIPLVDSIQWNLCKKIHRNSKVKRIGDLNDYIINRGEINQTVFREFISNNPNHKKLLKGVQIGKCKINTKLSQGKIEFFDEDSFLKKNNKKEIINFNRIATQRITGVDEKLRIVSTLVESDIYFADSTNSIILQNNSNYMLEYLLGLFNSKLYQWRFKLTSTNNNVGTNELKSLPFRIIDFSNPDETNIYKKIISLVNILLELNKSEQQTKTPQEKTALQRQIDAAEKQIDKLVYELYGLTEDEIKIVESS